jgi:hypothetical protein
MTKTCMALFSTRLNIIGNFYRSAACRYLKIYTINYLRIHETTTFSHNNTKNSIKSDQHAVFPLKKVRWTRIVVTKAREMIAVEDKQD